MRPTRTYVYLILLLWFALLAKSLQLVRPEFRPWELLCDPQGIAFQKSKRVEMVSVGDLGYKSWVHNLQSPRRVTFTTDRFGFRNLEATGAFPVVVLGDSFVVGSGLSDDETLTYQLGRQLGAPAYNFGAQRNNVFGFYLQDQRFVRQPPRFVVYAPTDRAVPPGPRLTGLGSPLPDRGPDSPILADIRGRGHQAVSDALMQARELLNRDNGITHAFRFAYHGALFHLFGLENQLMVDGKPALVLGIEDQLLHLSVQARRVDLAVQMLHEMSQITTRRGSQFIFCPIPGPGSIYPELYPETQQAKIVRPAFLDVLFQKTRERGLRVVDLRPLYQRNKTPYLYLPDDTHWSPRAVALAAGALAAAMKNPAENQ